MSKKKGDRPVFSEHNKEAREREITEWVNRKLDDELMKWADEQSLSDIDWSEWWVESHRDEDQSAEVLALRAAETGDLGPLRELYPWLVKFLSLPKKENRGGDRRTEAAKREAKEKYERTRLALCEYRRIIKLLKYLKVKPIKELAVKIAAARHANFDADWAEELLRRKFGAELLHKCGANELFHKFGAEEFSKFNSEFFHKYGAEPRHEFEEGLRHEFEAELEQALRHPSAFYL